MRFLSFYILVFAVIFYFNEVDAQNRVKWLNGYAKTRYGEIISYHSNNPHANSALLVRSLDGAKYIEWETEPLPKTTEKYITFVWIAGIDVNENPKRFDIYVNNEHKFSIKNPKDTQEKSFRFSNEDLDLLYNVDYIDQYDDFFGYMFLKVPVEKYPAGFPLIIKVVGENANLYNWYMILQYKLENKINLKSIAAAIKGKKENYNLIKMDIEHFNDPAPISVISNGKDLLRDNLKIGYNSFYLTIPAVEKEVEFPLIIKINKKIVKNEILKLKPVQKMEVYLLPHSHNDIGYSDLQADVEKKQWKNLDNALELSKKSSSNPFGSVFKWNVEILWAVESYLENASEEKKHEFIEAAQKGYIGLQAFFSGQLTGLSHPEELVRITEYARILSRKYGLTINSVMLTDIPGFNWSVVPALSLSGIKYFSSGPNYMQGTPELGDRVGYSNRAWMDKPFYWISPSGENKILFWMAGKGYSWFHGWNSGSLSKNKGINILDYMGELKEKNYPYDMVQVRYTIGGDNGPTDPQLSDFVKEWNEKYISPRIIISTTDEMFKEFERRYESIIPEFKGDFTPYWEDGAASTAHETSVNRNTAERLTQAEALWAMFDPENYPAKLFYSAWRKEILFNEHTWGAHNSISEPDSPFVISQWKTKQSFALGAQEESQDLLSLSFKNVVKPATDKNFINIVNTNSWPKTDLVILPKDLSMKGDVVKDENNIAIPAQRLSNGDLAFMVKDIPPFSIKKFYVEKGMPIIKGNATVKNNRLKNGLVDILLDETTGSIKSLKWEGYVEDFVNKSENFGLNEYLYVPGRNPQSLVTNSNVKIKIKENGPIVASLLIESDAPGCNSLIREVRVIDNLDRIDIFNILNKKKIRQKESVHFAYPFNISGGKIRIDLGLGVIEPEKDQLRGSCKDYFCQQRWIDNSNDSIGVTFVSPDVPLIEIGKITDESLNETGYKNWLTKAAEGKTVYSYVMNNYWHTNYKADQEGVSNFKYSILPHKKFDRSKAYKFGIGISQPLVVFSGELLGKYSEPVIELNSDGIIVNHLKPSENTKGFIIRLYNTSENTQTAVIKWKGGKNIKIYLSNAFEDKLEEIQPEMIMKPLSFKTIFIEEVK